MDEGDMEIGASTTPYTAFADGPKQGVTSSNFRTTSTGGETVKQVLEVDGMTCMANCGSTVKGALLQVRIGVHGPIL